METKEIDGVLYELVPEEKKKSCRGCAFYDPNGSVCTTLTDNCNKGFIYKEIDKPISTSNLKPFNLEEAKAGKPVCTRDGRKARIICFDKKGAFPIVALVNDYNEEEYIKSYDKFGKKIIGGETSNDLMMLPEKKTGWININKDEGIFKSREEAERNCSDNYFVVEVEWEE